MTQEEWNKKRTVVECYSRIVGYLRPVSQWHEGKVSEWVERKPYNKQLCQK